MRTSLTHSKASLLMITSILISFSILIPILMPIKLIIGPASYTLASHVPIFIGMFLSPMIASIVALGATVGFFIAGFPIIIVMRALSHLIFVLIGAYLIKILRINHYQWKQQLILMLIINLFHSLGEVSVVYLMTAATTTPSTNYWYTLWGLVGLGTFIHGCIDYLIALLIAKRIGLNKIKEKLYG